MRHHALPCHLTAPALLCLLLSACSSPSPADGPLQLDAPDQGVADMRADQSAADMGPAPVVGQDATVTIFDGAHFFFTGAENRRQQDVTVALPPRHEQYAKAELEFTLSCPPNMRCDPWDRHAHMGVVLPGEAGAEGRFVELERFITPYNVGMSWRADVTDLRPLLAGEVTFRALIDTWVGPGSQYGDGWALTVKLHLTGGQPARPVLDVVPVWTDERIVYGDPSVPTEPARQGSVTVPLGASKATLRALVTGHGQGNASNCAEFCPRTHTVALHNTSWSHKVWRADCDTTAAPDQQGTWQYPRAGWCPGARVIPWETDMTTALGGAEIATWYGVETYENTCRPGAEPCAGCTLGTGCDYNDSTHTEPHYKLSALLILYR